MASAKQVWELSRALLADSNGLVAVLKVYMDESGTHDHSPVVTVAAYVGRPREWQAWTKHWNIAKRPIKVFHAVDAQHLHNEFEGWSDTARDAVVKRVLSVIVESGFPGIVIGIHMDEFRRAFGDRPGLTDVFGTPYGACFQWVVQSLMFMQFKARSSERIALVHECNDYQQEKH